MYSGTLLKTDQRPSESAREWERNAVSALSYSPMLSLWIPESQRVM